MFLLALIYLIVLVVFGILADWTGRRLGSAAEIVLFTIIGIVLFWSVLNK